MSKKQEALGKLLSTVGAKVRIRRDSEFARQNDGIGEVIGKGNVNGWMEVKFENGKINGYRIGKGGDKCDLELADPQGDLGRAIADNDIDKVKLLIDAEVADLNKKDSYDCTYLDNVLKIKKSKIAKLLISGGADVNLRANEWSPLERAIRRYPSLVPDLISAGADVNSKDETGRTALMMAVEDHKIDCIKQLLDAGADPEAKTGEGRTVSSFANNSFEILKLLKKGNSVEEKNNELIKALNAGLLDEAKKLLTDGADINVIGIGCSGYTTWNPMHLAARDGDTKTIKFMIENGVDVNIIAENLDGPGSNWSPLHFAAYNGHGEIVKMLLDAGADASLVEGKYGGKTAEGLAKKKNKFSVVKILEEHSGLSVKEKNEKLIHALDAGLLDEAKKLLTDGANINVTGKGRCYETWSPLHLAARDGEDRTVKFMIENGVDVNIIASMVNGHSDANWTPLHFAASNGRRDAVKVLLDAGADISLVNRDGRTAEKLASKNGYSDVVKIFEEHKGKGIEDKNEKLATALRRSRFDEAKKLLAEGADINMLGADSGHPNWSPLHLAVMNGRSEIVKFMLDNGVDVNILAKRVDGVWDANWTALHFAAKHGRKDTVQKLLDADADASLKCKNGKTAEDFAVVRNHRGVVKIFEEHKSKDVEKKNEKLAEALRRSKLYDAKKLLDDGADINLIGIGCSGYRTWNPMHLAARDGDVDTVKFMLENGVDVNAIAEHVDQSGANWSPLHFAAYNGHGEIVKMLLDAGADISLVEGKYDKTALGLAENQCYHGIIELLKKHAVAGVDNSALFSAIDHGDLDEVKKLIAGGINVDKRNNVEWSPLEKAIKYLPEAVPFLISAGADVNSKDKAGSTALWMAIDYKNEDLMIKQLLDAGAEITDSDISKAKGNGYTEIVKLLEKYKNGTERSTEMTQEELDRELINLFNKSNSNFDADEAKRLIEAGADVNVSDLNGWTPLHLASRDVAKIPLLPFLLKKGAKVNVNTSSGGQTPIYLAVYNSHIDVVKQLLDAGADPHMKIHGGRTAFHAANSEVREIMENWKPKKLTDKLFATISKAAHRGLIAGGVSGSSNFVISQVDRMLGNPELLQLGVSRPALKALIGISFIGLSRQYPDKFPHAEIVEQASVLLLEAGAEEGVDEVCDLVEPILVEFMSDITAIEPGEEPELLESSEAEGVG